MDFLIDKGQKLIPVEVKSGETITSDYFTGLGRWVAKPFTSGGLALARDQGLDSANLTPTSSILWNPKENKKRH